MNKKELDFAVFCIENIAERLNLSGAVVYNMLTTSILDEYIIPGYEALHTQGKEYFVNDIIELMINDGLLT